MELDAVADRDRPLRVVGVVVDRLGEQRDDLVVVADPEQRVRHRREVHVAARGARRAVRHPAVGAIGLEPVDERATLAPARPRPQRRGAPGSVSVVSPSVDSRRLGRLGRRPRSSPPSRRPTSSSCRPLPQCRQSNPWRPFPAWSSHCVVSSSSPHDATATSAITESAASTFVLRDLECTNPPVRPPNPQTRRVGATSISTGCPRVALHRAAHP